MNELLQIFKKDKSATILSSFLIIGVLFSEVLCWNFWGRELYPFVVICLSGTIALWLVLTRQSIISLTITDIFILIFFIYAVGNAFFKSSINPPSDRIFYLVCSILFYVTIKLFWNSSKQYQIWVFAILSCILIQCFFGILQYFFDVNFGYGPHKITGTFTNPGIYGCFVAIGVPIVLYQLIYTAHYSKSKIVLLCIVALIVFMSLILSSSRTAGIASVVAAFVVSVREIYPKTSRILRYKFFSIIGTVILFILFISFLWQKNTLSISGRLLIWKISFFEIFLNYPITGIGYGNFFTEYGNYQRNFFLSGQGNGQDIALAGMTYYPFNEYLRISIENGIVGLLLFIAIIASVLNHKVRLFRSDNLLYLAVMLLILGCSFFSYPLENMSIYIILIITIVALSQNNGKELSVIHIGKKIPKMFSVALIILILIFSSLKISAVLKWKDAQENILVNEEKSYKTYKAIYPLLSQNGAFLFNYGAELLSISDYRNSLRVLMRATKYGNSVELYMYLGDAYTGLQNNDLAEEYYIKSAYMVPKLFTPVYKLFLFYQRTNQIEKARLAATKIIDMPIKVPSEKIDKIKYEAFNFLY